MIELISACASEEMKTFAVIGMITTYLLLAALVYMLARTICDELDFNLGDTELILLSLIFPVAIIGFALGGIIYYIGRWLLFPLIGATKRDLSETESRLNYKIEESLPAKKKSLKQLPKVVVPKAKFKVGDKVTGVSGNPDGYKVLYEGCVCRVLSIDERGQMKLLLLDHKDKIAHKDHIGQVYTGPARNFVLLSRKK